MSYFAVIKKNVTLTSRGIFILNQIDPLPLLEKQRLRRRFLDDEKIIEELIDF